MVLDGSLPVRGSDRRGDNPALRGLPVVAHLSGRCEAGTTVLRFELGEGSPPRGGAEGPFCWGAAEREAEDRRPRFATAPHNPTRGNRSNPRCRGTAGRPLLDDPPLPRCVTSRSAYVECVVVTGVVLLIESEADCSRSRSLFFKKCARASVRRRDASKGRARMRVRRVSVLRRCAGTSGRRVRVRRR